MPFGTSDDFPAFPRWDRWSFPGVKTTFFLAENENQEAATTVDVEITLAIHLHPCQQHVALRKNTVQRCCTPGQGCFFGATKAQHLHSQEEVDTQSSRSLQYWCSWWRVHPYPLELSHIDSRVGICKPRVKNTHRDSWDRNWDNFACDAHRNPSHRGKFLTHLRGHFRPAGGHLKSLVRSIPSSASRKSKKTWNKVIQKAFIQGNDVWLYHYVKLSHSLLMTCETLWNPPYICFHFVFFLLLLLLDGSLKVR